MNTSFTEVFLSYMQLVMRIQTDVLIVVALDLIAKSYESGGVNANNFIFYQLRKCKHCVIISNTWNTCLITNDICNRVYADEYSL